MKKKHSILIVGGGFAGISTALELCKMNRNDLDITLISNRDHFEYHATLYRLVSGRSADEVAIPLKTLFENKPVTIIKDRVTRINRTKNVVLGVSKSYHYDSLIVAIGSEPAYYSIPGLKTHAFTLYKMKDALKLNRHIQEMIQLAADDEDEAVEDAHFVIIGGGATGVELAGEMALYTRKLCKEYELDPSYVTIDLIEANHRVLSQFPPRFSKKVQNRLRDLDVNVFLNQKVLKNKKGELELKNMDIRSKTIIWTAGMKTHSLYKKFKVFDCDERGKVAVTEELKAVGCSNIYIAGDAAKTLHCGLAPIALWHGEYIARNIIQNLDGKKTKPYKEKGANSAIPVGMGWAAVAIDNIYYYGAFGWFLRRYVDYRFFNKILPFSKALIAFKKAHVFEDTRDITLDEL